MNLISKVKTLAALLLLCFLVAACGDDKPTEPAPPMQIEKKYKVTKFDGQAAYDLVAKQVAFGYRVPGTEAHKQTAEWLVQKFEEYGAQVIVQDFIAETHYGEKLPSKNIIAQINPSAKERILFGAHWDSRYAADKDDERADQPIAGADDGGSGTAVLLQLAKQLQENPIEAEDLGVDFILFDAEDQGKDGDGTEDTSTTWCLGSQHWSKNVVPQGYSAKYGILLDMVGSANPRFGYEGYSMQINPQLVDKVWKKAQNMGYSNYFVRERTGAITDDHYYVAVNAGIPMIDIINLPEGSGQRSTFGPYHHTHDDDMDIISKKSLRIVGQVMLAVIYAEANNNF